MNNRTAIQAAVEARLARRYRAEARFRLFGILAIMAAISVLILLIGSIGAQSIPAFRTNELTLQITVDPARVDPAGDRSEASLRRGSYSSLMQAALREQFPSIGERSQLRELFGLYTPLNSARLLDEVIANPDLVGQTIDFSFPISDDADLYLKGLTTGTSEMRPGFLATPSGTSGEITLRANANVFSPIVSDIRAQLTRRALAVEERVARYRQRAANATSEESIERFNSEAEHAAAEAAELRALAEPGADSVEMSPDLPSRLVRINGGTVLIERISDGGRVAEGHVLVGLESAEASDDWTIWTLETPQAERRITDSQIAWAEVLRERGLVRSVFNTYLFTNADSREPELAGVLGAMIGSALTMLVTMLLAVPIGVATAVYLEEFAPKNRLTGFIEVNINNLAAVPSIVFGLLGLAVFISLFGLPRSAPLVGGMVLALMTLPTVIISSRAALKAVPPSIREAALGVGASKIQTVTHHVLPLAAPGILTGSIIGLAQALGETAPLLMIGMVAFVADAPSLSLSGLTEPATVMPVQIFLWSDGAERAFEPRTAAAILILLALMILFNAAAVFLRRRFERRW
ncbi:phosphate ABC transporter permease PstA [Hyphobacterium sp. HN65]|uniref:Phosphate transport system permease protein PstA n=1 Tax=Hyphobacterium lacteum TaxID=3116575 RepID=A0ABU7LPD3_9PROT|nr:phosphate ABC transporter permease PstA [Hyphobacterium sp. HN65]MEE2525459.1 phosphate ABC transporter permease PstA [Hyphobacterium sp. HN65]